MTTQTTQKPVNNRIHGGPAVYVGTYAKYNSGSIAGAWIDLDDYAGDEEGFLDACKAWHADEADPELMFQDYQGFPAAYYHEGGLEAFLFEWLELDDDERELMERYEDATGSAADSIEEARERFLGKYESGADYAEQLAYDCGYVPKNLPSWIEASIDWEKAWDHNLRYDCSYSEPRHDEIWIFQA